MSTPHPLIFVWPYALLFWTVLSWVYLMEARQIRRKAKLSGGWTGDDRYSGLVISLGSSLLQLGALALAYRHEWSMPEAVQPAIFLIGIAVTMSGTLLRMHCWKALGEFFTHTVTIASNHRVINIGAYRFLRHPAYLGGWLNLIGLGLALGNYASLALITLGAFAMFHYRIQVEEKALERALGDAYRSFKQSRARLIPFVY